MYLQNLSSGFVINKGADQPAHRHSLISAFVIRFLQIMIHEPASKHNQIF